MSYTISEIEDKILEVLGGLSYPKTLKSYQGTLEELLEKPEEMIVRSPAILVTLGGNRYHPGGHPVNVYTQVMQFVIIAADGSLRGEESRRRGSVTNPGTYQMLDDVRTLLAGKKLGLVNDDPPIRIVSEDALFSGKINGRFFSIYAAVYELDLDFTTP